MLSRFPQPLRNVCLFQSDCFEVGKIFKYVRILQIDSLISAFSACLVWIEVGALTIRGGGKMVVTCCCTLTTKHVFEDFGGEQPWEETTSKRFLRA